MYSTGSEVEKILTSYMFSLLKSDVISIINQLL